MDGKHFLSIQSLLSNNGSVLATNYTRNLDNSFIDCILSVLEKNNKTYFNINPIQSRCPKEY